MSAWSDNLSLLRTAEAIGATLASIPRSVIRRFENLTSSEGPPGTSVSPVGPIENLPMRGVFQRDPADEPFTTTQPFPISSLSLEDIEKTIAAHDMGQFFLSARLWDTVRKDPRVFTTIETRVLGVLGLPFSVRAAKAKTKANKEKAAKYARELEDWFQIPFPPETLADFDRWKIGLGLAVGNQWWYFDEQAQEVRVAGVRVHHPMHLNWRFAPRQGYWLTTTQGVMPVTPGDGQWLLITSGSSYPWMNGVIRCLGKTYILRQQALQNWGQRSEQEGAGITVGRVPQGTRREISQRFMSQLASMGANTKVLAPPGFDIERKPVDAAAAGAFEKLTGQCDTDITLPVLGQNLTTQIEKGSMAAANVHARVQLDRISSDCSGYAQLKEQTSIPWGRYNYPDFADQLAPTPWFDPTPPDDLKARAAALQMLSQALDKLAEHGVDVEELVCQFHLEMNDINNIRLSQISDSFIKNGVLTVNEIRTAIGLEPVPGGDERAKVKEDASIETNSNEQAANGLSSSGTNNGEDDVEESVGA